ncbi:5,10-methylenetetrahydrofolate reductase [Chitinophaga jiangningensis]|uniref:Methylenetetrahydrofolate reductase n=1 Tax=Chitinophaga jiangningensis TaxID=1419482 RepID=A0A1M7BZ35_9BACT|nr:methylenetetrahydrofolate reductase [Chitinophaga jiangningensis]SHL60265.1 5,10-methylenetetrahydrofolate reductase [Chitinophaga jiangningensis]
MQDLLKTKLVEGQSGIVLYSLTPPKITTEEERVTAIAYNQVERLKNLDIDGLILYDIQDESLRTEKERTFSFIPTIAPEQYSKQFLADLSVPKIIYKSIANQTKETFSNWLEQNEDLQYSVFVGASSHQQVAATQFSLSDAYDLKKASGRDFILGGVTIPERHNKKGDEHLRIFNKMDQGCNFFVSQCVYNLHDTKNLLSDYYYNSVESGKQIAPVIFTLAPCGSLKTLQFMEWLGIEVPKWLYNDLKNSKDILKASLDTTTNIAAEILNYAQAKNMPVGFNIESVSIKKEEINAAQELLHNILDLTKEIRKPKKAARPAPAY